MQLRRAHIRGRIYNIYERGYFIQLMDLNLANSPTRLHKETE